MSVTDDTTIHVSDPVYREEVLVTRGNHVIYLVKYEDDTRYAIVDKYGNGTTHTWRGDIDGIADFQSLADIFDDVYGSDA